MQNVFQQMVENWKAPIVPRTEIDKFTGGVITEKYIANLDCQGKGPEGRFRIGRKIVYPTVELAAWLEDRSEAVR